MTRYTSLSIGDYPHPFVRVACRKCSRNGKLSRERLIRDYGADTVMPDLRSKIAQEVKCERVGQWHDPCGAYFVDLAPDADKS